MRPLPGTWLRPGPIWWTTWFHDASVGPSGVGDLFRKRYNSPDGGPSFLMRKGGPSSSAPPTVLIWWSMLLMPQITDS